MSHSASCETVFAHDWIMRAKVRYQPTRVGKALIFMWLVHLLGAMSNLLLGSTTQLPRDAAVSSDQQ